MRVQACREFKTGSGSLAAVAAAAVAAFFIAATPAFALDSSAPSGPVKISPKSFTSPKQALRAGVEDLQAGDPASSIPALTYAADGGETVARWKLGEMYADGVGVTRNDLKAYQYFNQLVDDYDEDAPDQKNLGAVSNAYVAVGVYSLTGIKGSTVRADPERARDLFQFAASNFWNPDAEFYLARMYIEGTGGLAKDNITAARWLGLAAVRGHRPSQAVLGDLLYFGDGVPQQRARGLMWLKLACAGAESPKDDWILDLCARDVSSAADVDRQMATVMLDERSKGSPLPTLISRKVIEALQFLRPFKIAATPDAK